MAFQLFHLHGHCRRREVQHFSSAGKTEVFGDLGENPELAEGGALD
jgi:hypothetical protein